jgi:diacylglycerol kinase family enzyme
VRLGRLAAWLALLSAGAAAGALAALLVTDPAAALAALGALVTLGALLWFAAARRGLPGRLAAAGIAVLALAGAVALAARGAAGTVLLLGGALAVFVAAARTALRRPAPASAGPAPACRAVLLMNPASGAGAVERLHLAAEARRRGIEPVLLPPGHDLRALAWDAARRADVIGVAGGDGSLAAVAEAAVAHGIPFVCVPAGSRNHLARDLGLEPGRNGAVRALDAFGAGVERRIDLGIVNGRAFVNNVALGACAEVVRSRAHRRGRPEPIERELPALLRPRARPFDLRFAGPDGPERRTAQLVLVSNNPRRFDRLVSIGCRPWLDTGRLGIVTVQVPGAAAAAELLALEAVGQVRRSPGWLEWSARTFEVGSGAPVAAGVDGEALTLEPPLRFQVAPRALRVRLPAGASPPPGPAAETLVRLWRMAAGRP